MTDTRKILSELEKRGVDARENEPLSAHTSFRIGGPAAVFVLPRDAEGIMSAVKCANDFSVPYFILGRGSNVVFADEGYDGIVICTGELDKIDVCGKVITAGAGVSLASVCSAAADASLSGMECLYGIPGSVGGGVFMNAGAYGTEIADVLLASSYLELDSGEISTLDKDSHKFAYRRSSYADNAGRVIISAAFELCSGDAAEIKNKMSDVQSRRREKQPLEYPSAGSAFKRYPGRYTAQLIDEAGLRGFAVGGAQVSEKHAGFIVNRGGATCADVRALVDIIREKIHEIYKIDIETEIIFVK